MSSCTLSFGSAQNIVQVQVRARQLGWLQRRQRPALIYNIFKHDSFNSCQMNFLQIKLKVSHWLVKAHLSQFVYDLSPESLPPRNKIAPRRRRLRQSISLHKLGRRARGQLEDQRIKGIEESGLGPQSRIGRQCLIKSIPQL